MKLYFSGALPVLWIFLLTMKLVSCEPLDSNESSEIEQPAPTCPNKVLPFLEETMRNLHRDQFLPEIKTYVASEIGKIHIQFCISQIVFQLFHTLESKAQAFVFFSTLGQKSTFFPKLL